MKSKVYYINAGYCIDNPRMKQELSFALSAVNAYVELSPGSEADVFSTESGATIYVRLKTHGDITDSKVIRLEDGRCEPFSLAKTRGMSILASKPRNIVFICGLSEYMSRNGLQVSDYTLADKFLDTRLSMDNTLKIRADYMSSGAVKYLLKGSPLQDRMDKATWDELNSTLKSKLMTLAELLSNNDTGNAAWVTLFFLGVDDAKVISDTFPDICPPYFESDMRKMVNDIRDIAGSKGISLKRKD